MTTNIHRAGRPRKTLERGFAENLLTAYQTRTTRQLAQDYNVSQPTICKWLKIARTMGGETNLNE